MDPILGQLILFAGNFAPVGWAHCNGELRRITENTALFSILGTQYGGDGVHTFAMPKLDAPVEGLRYLIAIQGVFPSRQ